MSSHQASASQPKPARRRRLSSADRARPDPLRPQAVTGRIDWRYALPIGLLHLLAMLACVPWFFSWSAVALLIVGIYFYGGIGVNIAYHRLLTHRSFVCPTWLERFFVVVALCCFEDVPAIWVANHRLHHKHSDHRPDPHSPNVGFFWSHMGWLLIENRELRSLAAYDRFARDILQDRFYMRLQRGLLGVWIYVGHAYLYLAAGLVVGWLSGRAWLPALQLGLSWLVWGVFLRTVCVWHITWSVNSLAHMGGYRRYETNENSRNNWFVALLTSGEGWHNNHHHDPASASNAHRWWELDLMYLVIRALEASGLAWNVIRPRCQRADNVPSPRDRDDPA
jgi:stearoyl-CoA desaturase (delta-9 desaturase)